MVGYTSGRRRQLCRTLVAALALWSFVAVADIIDGEVVGITDGDTLTLLDGERHQHHIRLMGIDAPEKRQAFGTRSREHLAELSFQRDAVVEFTKRDRYGRIVGKVVVDGQDVGLAQIRAGLAWHYRQYAREQVPADRDLYTAAEVLARLARRGLWVDESPLAPWDFRQQLKTSKPTN
jgi:endonuclease YncB( thermonuclease family)